jgi:antitoxin FitA
LFEYSNEYIDFATWLAKHYGAFLLASLWAWYNATIMVARHRSKKLTASSLTIRNIPRPVLTRLHERAGWHQRSMQGEILAILEAAAAEPNVRRNAAQALRFVRELGISTKAESVKMIRSDRDEL